MFPTILRECAFQYYLFFIYNKLKIKKKKFISLLDIKLAKNITIITFQHRVDVLVSNQHCIQYLSTLHKSILGLGNHFIHHLCLVYWLTLRPTTYKYNSPTKLISLKSLRSSAPPFFGIKTKKVTFKLFTNLPYLWNSLKNKKNQKAKKKKKKKLIISSFTKSQLNYHNAIEKPSKLGVLSPLRSERAKKMTSTENSSSNLQHPNLSTHQKTSHSC